MSLIEEALKKAQREGEPPRFRPTGGGKAGRGGRRGPKLMIGVIVLLFLVVGGAYFLLRYYEGLPVELIKALPSRALSVLSQEKAPVLQEVPSPASPSKGEISSSGAAEGGVAFKVEEVSGPEKVKEVSAQGEKQKIVPSVSPPDRKPKPPPSRRRGGDPSKGDPAPSKDGGQGRRAGGSSTLERKGTHRGASERGV